MFSPAYKTGNNFILNNFILNNWAKDNTSGLESKGRLKDIPQVTMAHFAQVWVAA